MTTIQGTHEEEDTPEHTAHRFGKVDARVDDF